MEKSEKTKEKFNALYAEWQRVIQDPKIRVHSRPREYIDNEPYRQIVKLGKAALPFVLERISEGVFFMNQAALEIADTKLEDLLDKENMKTSKERLTFLAERIPTVLSEQQKSKLILKHIMKE